jgi:rhamnogalacturonan endolyase
VGKFLPDREGLQVYHCLETGKTMVALHDARDGAVIWKKDAAADNDMGRCMVADLLPQYPGCEFYYYKSYLMKSDGTNTTVNSGDKGWKGGCSMGIWFDGNLSRQLIEDNIINSPANGRTFTMYRYDESFNNGTKSNPGWYGDMVGDWREEVILPDATKLKDLKIFATWYPTTHKFPWLMTDHTYYMACVNQNVGYNQPNNLGYYLGTDVKNDADAWAAAATMMSPNAVTVTAIQSLPSTLHPSPADGATYSLTGQQTAARRLGVYIRGGKKIVKR